MSPAWTLRKIVLKAALPGIITGLLVAIAISVGETAPLLYTAGWSDFEPDARTSPTRRSRFLTYPICDFYAWTTRAQSPVLRRRPAAVRPVLIIMSGTGSGRDVAANAE